MSQSSTSDPPNSPSSGKIVAGLPCDSNTSVKPSCTSDTDAYTEGPRHANNVTSNPIISSSENANTKTESNSSSSYATANNSSSANRRRSGLSNLMSGKLASSLFFINIYSFFCNLFNINVYISSLKFHL